MRYLAVAILLAGCGSLNELRGWNATAQVVLSDAILADVAQIREIVKKEKPEDQASPLDEVVGLTEVIEIAATDNRDRAMLSQLDHNHLPERPVVIGEEEDILKKTAYAGRAVDRNASREWWAGFSERLAKGFGKFTGTVIKSMLPGWAIKLISALAAGLLVFVAFSIAVWVKATFWKKAYDESDGAIETLPKEQRIELGKSRKYMSKAHEKLK